jgi:glyoxalase family protein
VENDAALTHEHQRLKRADVKVSDVYDCLYSKLFYFRDPDGHICALSTPTQLTIDEPIEELGTKLCLAPDLEDRRIEIERNMALRPAPVPLPQN